MPNRILRDWTDSERVNALSANAEVFFVRLIMKADDRGRHNAAPQLLKSYLYPLKDVRIADISRWCAECVDAGLIANVESNGKRYIEIQKFGQSAKKASGSIVAQPENIYFDYDGDRKIHGITAAQLDLWREFYDGLDVGHELRQASAWLDANRRRIDIKRFLVNWLNKAQDRAKNTPANSATTRYGRQPLDEEAVSKRAAHLREVFGDDFEGVEG